MDRNGIHSIIFGDHLFLGENVEAYPYGKFMHPSNSSWMEPLTTLSAMAAVTEKLILATGILIAPLRSSVLLAKSIATLDVISNGRTQLALGVGWQKEEYQASGILWEERYARLESGMRACRAIWGDQPVTYDDGDLRCDRYWFLPRPVQQRVPLLLGLAMTPKNAVRMAVLGDGWCPVNVTPDQVATGVAILRQAAADAGRDMSDLHVRVGIPHVAGANGKVDVRASLAAVPAYREAGGTIFTIAAPPSPDSMSEIYRFIEEVGEAARA